jgi:Archaeal phage integrase
LVADDLSSILALSADKRTHVMKALTSLSKFCGCYDYWRSLIRRYNLRWTTSDSLKVFQNIVSETSYSEMLNWLKDTLSKLPESYSNTLIYNTLTGLRPSEALQSLYLVQSELKNYLNKDKVVLEHFKYPAIFLRRTKKVYISIVNDLIIRIAEKSRLCSYSSLSSMLKRRKIQVKTYYCRKIFATFLRNEGIEQEIIDLLQGRIPKSVFVRHYYKPDWNTFDRINEKLRKLYESIVTIQ